MVTLRLITPAGWVAVSPWQVDPEAPDRELRAGLIRAVHGHRRRVEDRGDAPDPLTLQIAPRADFDWRPVLAAEAGEPVRIDCPFAADWSTLIARLRLASRHGLARGRLRDRTLARRRPPVE